MRAFWYFVHIFAQIAWVGGSLAAMTIAAGGRREPEELAGTVVRLQAGLYRSLVGPGALFTVLSGIVMTLQLYNRFTAVGISHWLLAMQGVGIAGALVALVHTVPTSSRLARLEPVGPSAAAFHGLRRRLRVSGMVQGLLAMLGVLTAAMYQVR
jgi:hypothetical protein